jgi:transcription antitermination factor NusG
VAEQDYRDDITWVVLELTPAGEKHAEEGLLEKSLRDLLEIDFSFPLFVPYATFVRNGRRSVLNVVEGYAFVASGLTDSTYLSLPVRSPYINAVLHRSSSGRNMPVLTTVPDKSIRSLKANLAKMISREIEEGSSVRVVEGFYVGFVGTVISFEGDNAHVLIDLRSLKAIKTLPKFFLRPTDGILGFDAQTEVYPAYPGEDGEEVD